MGCSGCGKSRSEFRNIVKKQIAETRGEIPVSLSRAERIEARNKRIEARNKRIDRRNKEAAKKP